MDLTAAATDDQETNYVWLMTNDLQSIECDRNKLSEKSPYFKKVIEEVGSSKEIVILVPSGRISDIHYIVEYINHGEINFNRKYKVTELLFLARKFKIEGLRDCVVNRRKTFFKSELQQYRTLALQVIKYTSEMTKSKILAVDVLDNVFSQEITYRGKKLGMDCFDCRIECMGFNFYDIGNTSAKAVKEKVAKVVLEKLLEIEIVGGETLSECEAEEEVIEKDEPLTAESDPEILIPKLKDHIFQYVESHVDSSSIECILPVDIVRTVCQFVKQKYEPIMERNGASFTCSLPFLTKVYNAKGNSNSEAENAACLLALRSIIDVHFECTKLPHLKRLRTLFFSIVDPSAQEWNLYVNEINPINQTISFAMTLTERINFLLKNLTKNPEPGDMSRFIRPTTTPILTANEWKLLELIDKNLFPFPRQGDTFTLSVTINETLIFGDGSSLIQAKNTTIEKAFQFLEKLDTDNRVDTIMLQTKEKMEKVNNPKKKGAKSSCLKPEVPVRVPYF